MRSAATHAVGERDDAHEREADHAADAVVADASTPKISLAAISLIQREEKAPGQKSEEEKYKEAAKKAGEAFLQTGPGKEISEKAERLGEAFISTLPGKIITGGAIAGAVTALAATHRELPVGIPEIPLDAIKPGLKMKITYDGPVDKPTNVTATFSLPLGGGGPRTPAPSKSDQYRAETAKLARELETFREGLKTPEERERDRRLFESWMTSRLGAPGAPGLSFDPVTRPPGLGPRLPLTERKETATPSDAFKLTGETQQRPPEDEARKKKEASPVQRKAASPGHVAGTPLVVEDTLRTSGQPLDASARADMEARFGFDLSRVRIHTDAQAARSADAIGALAYTVGDHVVFGSGRYSPRTADGRHLLAHELAHVVQQGGGTDRTALTPTPARLALKKDADAPEPDPVEVAVYGDDDAVRDITHRADWDTLTITAEDAAAMLINLLDGPTGDDDENAGLAILRKELAALLLDDTLAELDDRARFEQLLDDYHGSEYRDLLKLLSENLRDRDVKAVYLDAFIAMWWVREHEEVAIVVLLEHTPPADQLSLLTEKNRISELRDAIDNTGPRTRYEVVVAGVNAAHGDQLALQLSGIFQIDANASVAKGQRTQEETRELLRRAAEDLTAELTQWKDSLAHALAGGRRNAAEVARINQEFEKRLKKLVDDKTAEFGFELRYNIEFNGLLEGAYRRQWTPEDLEQFDEMLQRIPPDILHPNVDFARFLRGAEHPKLGGVSNEGRITLFGQLNLTTTWHELGHQFHDTDANGHFQIDPWNVPVFVAFARLSGWQRLTRDDIMAGARDDKDRKARERLVDTLDRQRGREAENAREAHDGSFYRYDRYPRLRSQGGDLIDTYYRSSKDAKFVTDYAATDPQDDFADTFAYYAVWPEYLRTRAPEKYEFMHVHVFVAERLLRQANRILERYDERVHGVLELADVPWAVNIPFRARYVMPLRRDLEAALAGHRQRETLAAEGTVKDKPKPVPQAAAAEPIAAPFLTRLDNLLAVLGPVARASRSLVTLLEMQALFDVDTSLTTAQKEVGERLTRLYHSDLVQLADAPARRVLAGNVVNVGAWLELQALQARYWEALEVIPPYLPRYNAALGARTVFTSAAAKIIRRFNGHPKRPEIAKHMLDLRDGAFAQEIEEWKGPVLDRIRNLEPFDRKKVIDPLTIVKKYEKQASADATRIAAQRQAMGPSEPAGGAEAVREGVASPGAPLEDGTRARMEGRFGADFGDVRVHTGAQAADSARALDAKAFTVGPDIVFADSAYAPDTPEGEELLAHELTHVVQQEGATPAVSEPEARPLPPLSFEQIDLPKSENANEDATDAIAPVATPAADAPPSDVPTGEAIEAEPPKGESENAVAATPLNPDAPSPVVVPRSHESEREAERVSRAVVAADATHGPVTAPAIQRSAHARAQRQPAAKRERPAGIDVVFILGVDRNPKKNPFYREATKYFKATHGNATLVNDRKHRSLESVFDFLRDRGERVANLYLVSHANEDGTLSFNLKQSDSAQDAHVQYGELVTALKDEPALFQLPKGVIDEDTRIFIKGCNIGRSTRMLDALDQAFGGKGTVIAPTHKQVFGTKSVGRGKAAKVEHYEALKVYYLEYKGDQKIPAKEQQEEFIAKYPEVSEAQWKKWVPVDKRGRGGATRQPISISYTYRYSIDVKNKETKRMAEDEALPKAIEWGEANIGRPEMFEWKIQGSAKTKQGWLVTAVAEKTNYVVDKILVDEAGKRLEPPLTDAKYFGTSTYGDDAKKAAAGGASDTPALMSELAVIAAALPDLEGDERDEKLARKRELDAALAQRSALVDVNVVKTEDWLGADEVYVTVSGGAERFESPVKKLNDGQSDTFTVPLRALGPFDRPVKLEVFDEDLGWFFDRDDLIVTMEWAPPFADATNRESLDEADYRVRARL